MRKRQLRTLGMLTKDTQTRLRDYIAKWPTVSAKELAADLNLRPTTIAAVRAHLTRQKNRRFNEELHG